MKKVILGVAISLDGYIEGPNGEYDWCPPPSTKEMSAFMDGIDSIFFGRKSFELVGPSSFPDKKCYVFSNSLQSIKGKNVELVGGDVVSKVKNIKSTSGKNIWLFGGASLTTTFINEGLVDELWLGVVPIVLGAGKPLFQNINQRTHFKLTDSVTKNGYLSVRYSLKT
jgi:dihydrofolate reductase